MDGITMNPFGSIYGQTAGTVSDTSTSRLEDTLSGDFSNASDEELMEVCKDFEAYFVEQVFKEMKKMIPEHEDEDASMGQLREYFEDEMIQKFADQTAETANLGLAQTLYEQMKRNYNL